MNIEFQDRIDDYLLGRMSDEDGKAFEQELRNNDELSEQMELTKDVQTAIKSRNEKLAKMQEWEDDYELEDDSSVAAARYRPAGSGSESCLAPSMDQTRSMPRSSNRRYLYWISGIAAIFITGFFIFNNVFYGNKSEREIIYSPSQIEYGSMRGGGNFEKIEELIIGKDYKNALCQIEQEEKNLQEHEKYADSIYDAEQREYEKVVIIYNCDKLKWMKVYALLGLDRRNEAIMLLEELRTQNNIFKWKADSLYYLLK